MKHLIIAILLFGFNSAFGQSKFNSRIDTLLYREITLETIEAYYLLPNKRFLYYTIQGAANERGYGTWNCNKDSLHLTFDFINEYVDIKSEERKIDTNYTRSYKVLNKDPSHPKIDWWLIGPETKNIEFPTDYILYNKLK